MPATWAGWSYPHTRLGIITVDIDITDPKVIAKGGGYGVDANGDGKADPWDLYDAIFSAANYLAKSGAGTDMQKALYKYNQSSKYVNAVLARAASYASIDTSNVALPPGLENLPSIPVGGGNGAGTSQFISYTDLGREMARGLEPKFEYKSFTVNKWRKTVTISTSKDGHSTKTETPPEIIGQESKEKIVKVDTWRGIYTLEYKAVPGEWIVVKIIYGDNFTTYIYHMVEELVVKNMYYSPNYNRLNDKLDELGFQKYDRKIFEIMFNSQVNELSREVTNRMKISVTDLAVGNLDGFEMNPDGTVGNFDGVNQSKYPTELKPGQFCWPIPTIKKITSPFGPRWGKMHRGIDIDNGNSGGTPIYAAADGVVIHAGPRDPSGFGQAIYISHGNGIYTRYGHLQWNAYGVRTGDTVKKGQYIGQVGRGKVGSSTGAHLHFEIIINGNHTSDGSISGKWVNPLNYVRP